MIVGAFGDPFRDSTDRGVYVTNDGGKTWSKTLYVGTAERRSGAGDGPERLRPSSSRACGSSGGEPWTFHSGGPQDGIWRSADGGKTWTRLSGHGLPSGYMGRSARGDRAERLQAHLRDHRSKGGILWRTDDAGQNWTMVSSDTLVDQRPFYFTHINVDPKERKSRLRRFQMLAESKDGGHKFKAIAQQVHVDYHAMWIAPNDPKRMIVGEDGGYSLSLDGGKNWSFSRNIPIGQVYHVGLSQRESVLGVRAAAGQQRVLRAQQLAATPKAFWTIIGTNVIGGDGMWAVPDPAHPAHVMTDLQTGRIADYDKETQTSRYVQPYFDFNRYDFQLFAAKVPLQLGFADRVRAVGRQRALARRRRGLSIARIAACTGKQSVRTSRSIIKSHQQPSGGPLALDVSSAEFSDNDARHRRIAGKARGDLDGRRRRRHRGDDR